MISPDQGTSSKLSLIFSSLLNADRLTHHQIARRGHHHLTRFETFSDLNPILFALPRDDGPLDGFVVLDGEDFLNAGEGHERGGGHGDDSGGGAGLNLGFGKSARTELA